MASLLSLTFLPERFRGSQDPTPTSTPSWLNRKLTTTLQLLSRIACQHPIQTVVCVALAATGSYHGLLQESLFEGVGSGLVGRADWASLVDGSRHLKTDVETGWKWQGFEGDIPVTGEADHFALLTFVFPGSESSVTTGPDGVPLPANLTVRSLPTTSNSLTTYAQDKALAYAILYSQAPEFLSAAQEIPSEATEVRETHDGHEKRMWIMKAARVNPSSTVLQWAHNAWGEFLDLLKNAETLDIVIMILGYLAMHLTFVSLFVSMRRMGSNFWLAMSVLFSSTCAFLFGLAVTSQMGVSISVVLLSEGLPFLVVTIGFEKNIVLTRAVLSHAIEHRRPQNNRQNGHNRQQEADNNTIQYAVQAAIRETGFDIVRDYVIEIVILILGAASGVQGGLQQFCFLAAWILFFDGVLLFSFYTAILSIKLEINRIKRHVDMRKALEDDGVSRRVAERVAGSSDWPLGNRDTSIFGNRVKSNSVPKFKVLMVTGFVLVNVVNLCTIPFRSTDSFSSISSWAKGLGGVVTTPPVDPFKVASNGLDAILAAARVADRATVVTILTPIKYQLEYPSIHYAISASGAVENPDGLGYLGTYGVGGRVVGSLLKSLEDPVLSKWIIVALAMSVALNGYLFNAARWGIKDPNLPDHRIDPNELARAQKVVDNGSPTFPLGEYMPPFRGHAPSTPAPTDDEAECRPASVPRTQPPATSAVNRSFDVLESMVQDKKVHEMTDDEVVAMCLRGKIAGHSLEKVLKDFTRAVRVRRSIISRTRATAEITGTLEQSKLPYENYSWETVFGACCENVIGYMPLPVGVAGPIVVDGQSYFLPMATTEGVLVASTSRGAKAINAGGGAVTVLTHDGMTRGPVVSFVTLERAGAAKLWLDSEAGQASMEVAFNSTSRYAKLRGMKTAIAGTNLYIRFKATTGDAMGMNMISKGVENALKVMAEEAGFGDMSIISVSGNFCADKKAAALNWIDGRGKGVVAEAIIPTDVVQAVLKTDVDSLVELNTSKNLIGSAMAGSIGGFNAHAANIVAAIFIATGQDPAQVVESANCITVMKNFNGALQISVSMPSIEVGTLGGGTILDPQGSMLDILGVRGSHPTTPGENARRLARIIGAAVLAGELSLCSALAAGHLVRAHLQHNRSAPPTRAGTPSIGGNSGSVAPVGLKMTSISRR